MKKYTTLHKFNNNNGLEEVISPENSTVQWMGFDRILVKEGESFTYSPVGKEAALVLQSGIFNATVEYKNEVYDNMSGERNCVFDEKPFAIYAPPMSNVVINAKTDLEFRVFTVLCEEGNNPYFVTPNMVDEGEPGNEALRMKRKYRHIFGAPGNANDGVTKLLIVGESVSCQGGWVGYPAHKHDFDNEEEAPLDEIFSFQLKGPSDKGGYILHQSYGENESGESWSEIEMINGNDYAVGIGEGYHTSMAAAECYEYLLWGLGGPTKTYKVKFDPRFDAKNF